MINRRIAEFEFEGRADDQAMTVPVVLSTEHPVERGDYVEVLSHHPGDVDLSRANPLPLLTSHNARQLPIGVIEHVHLDGKVLRGVARFSERAKELFADVKRGIIRGVSIGYELLDSTLIEGRKYRFKFRVLEASIVAIPADPNAGFNRGIGMSASSALRNYAGRELAKGLGELHTMAQALVAKPADGIGMSEKEIARYSILEGIRDLDEMRRGGQARKLGGIVGEAHRACVERYGELANACAFYMPPEIQCRVLHAATAGAGGYLVGTTTGGSYIDMLRNLSVARRLGAQHLPGQQGHLGLPRQIGAASVTWLQNETSTIVESGQTIEQVASSPKPVGVFTEVSRQLVLQSNPASEQLVMNDFAAVSALAEDDAILNGDGTAGKPAGISSTAGVGTFSGTTLGLAALTEAQQDLLDNNAMVNPGTLGYATTPTVAKLLKNRQRFTGTDTPLWQGALHDGQIEGVRSISSLQLPSATMVYGDWSQILIPEWGAPVIDMDPYAKFRSGIIGIRLLRAIDVIVRHAKAFSISSSIT